MRVSRLLQDVRPGERLVERGDRHWTLREMDTRAVPGARARTCLICESTEVIRRLWNYPNDWRELDDFELADLCEGSAR
ncbi:MAG: hypothetical protein ACM3SX_20565 [Deltaproteobacteria bacterium]